MRALPELLDELPAEARLARAGRAGHQHAAGHRLRRAALEPRFEQRELAATPDARSRFAQEERRGLVEEDLLAAQRERVPVALGDEARAQHAGGHAVELDCAGVHGAK